MTVEKDIIDQIVLNPEDKYIWLLWSDWLEENKLSDLAEIVRLRHRLIDMDGCSDRSVLENHLFRLIFEDSNLPPNIIRSNYLGMELSLIPSGQFIAKNSSVEKSTAGNEIITKLSKSYWISRYPVTQGQYLQLMDQMPWIYDDQGRSREKVIGINFPAFNISFDNAREFFQKLNNKEWDSGRLDKNWICRLPTEAEWEYACRGCTSTIWYWGDDKTETNRFAWYEENVILKDDRYPREVGQKLANAWGLYDMSGNIYEWCLDSFQDHFSGGCDPFVAIKDSELYVIRGGSYGSSAEECSSSYRDSDLRSYRSDQVGFRVVLAQLDNRY